MLEEQVRERLQERLSQNELKIGILAFCHEPLIGANFGYVGVIIRSRIPVEQLYHFTASYDGNRYRLNKLISLPLI